MAERHELGGDGRQASLFDALAPPSAPPTGAPEPDPAPRPWTPRVVQTPVEMPVDEPGADVAEALVEPAEATTDLLAGPTLDDVMSRVWEGLVTGLPASCPVCHAEVVPSVGEPLYGHCASCDMTID